VQIRILIRDELNRLSELISITEYDPKDEVLWGNIDYFYR
jgi:hypothetical protein